MLEYTQIDDSCKFVTYIFLTLMAHRSYVFRREKNHKINTHKACRPTN